MKDATLNEVGWDHNSPWRQLKYLNDNTLLSNFAALRFQGEAGTPLRVLWSSLQKCMKWVWPLRCSVEHRQEPQDEGPWLNEGKGACTAAAAVPLPYIRVGGPAGQGPDSSALLGVWQGALFRMLSEVLRMDAALESGWPGLKPALPPGSCIILGHTLEPPSLYLCHAVTDTCQKLAWENPCEIVCMSYLRPHNK